jgi:hypothetical protein
MSSPDFNRQRLEDLLFSAASRSLPEAERAELNALLRESAEARNFAARSLTFDATLADCLAASEARHRHAEPRPAPVTVDFKRPGWLAKAAAWIGALHLSARTAEAATSTSAANGTALSTPFTITLLMKKAVTSITAAILLLGGSGLYVIHRHNASSRDRVAEMETEIQSLSDQLGIKTTRLTHKGSGSKDAPKTVGVVQVLAVYEGDHRITRQEAAILSQFGKQLEAMDAEALENLLLDAEKLSNPINDRLAGAIMEVLARKDPAVATRIASQLVGRSSDFLFQMSHAALKAFDAWLAKDPAAADAWYVATAAAGGLNSKSIPMNGLENLAIDRSFARSRFSARVLADPAEAAAMLATMLPVDVTDALKSVTDPDALRQILPKLSPGQKGPAAEGAIKAMAAKDPDAAFQWAKSLEIGEQERDSLLAAGIVAAVEHGKLDLPGAAEKARDLTLDAGRRSAMLVSAATSVSLIPRKDEHVIDPENSVHWDRVSERIDWLRKEAPADSAGKTVGDFLGRLSYASHNLTKSLEAYENEVSRQGSVDPDLTIAFTFHLSLREDDRAKAAALELLNKLPPGAKRDHAIQGIEMNR